jgi:XTP/dITP diphosphohydrolase
MRRTPVVRRIVVATRNKNKLNEIRLVLEPTFDVVPCPAEVPEVAEVGSTYEENAHLKAVAVSKFVNDVAAADDTGFEVDALDGAPGLYSARFSGDGHNDAENRQKLLAALENVPPERRAARYRTVVVAHFPDGKEIVVEGVCEGSVPLQQRGTKGFGYDAVFIPSEGDGRSFAEMEPDEKNAISHRARAFRALRDTLMT